MIFHDILTEAVDTYQAARVEPDERPRIRPSSAAEGDQVWASSLGMCPLAAAVKRRQEEMKFPELLPENQPQGMFRMAIGNHVAEAIQEAMLWYYPENALAEVGISSHEVRGRVDLLYFDFEAKTVYIGEIKSRTRESNKYMDGVRLRDWFQVFSYEGAIKLKLPGWTVRSFIISASWYGFNTYEMVETATGFAFVDQHGNDYVLEGANIFTWKDEQMRQKYYLDNPEHREPPVIFIDEDGNFEDVEGRWQCASWHQGDKPRAYKTKANRPGVLRPNCPVGCHFKGLGSEHWITVDINDDGSMYVKGSQNVGRGEAEGT